METSRRVLIETPQYFIFGYVVPCTQDISINIYKCTLSIYGPNRSDGCGRSSSRAPLPLLISKLEATRCHTIHSLTLKGIA